VKRLAEVQGFETRLMRAPKKRIYLLIQQKMI
jgi:hypothetical protein